MSIIVLKLSIHNLLIIFPENEAAAVKTEMVFDKEEYGTEEIK